MYHFLDEHASKGHWGIKGSFQTTFPSFFRPYSFMIRHLMQTETTLLQVSLTKQAPRCSLTCILEDLFVLSPSSVTEGALRRCADGSTFINRVFLYARAFKGRETLVLYYSISISHMSHNLDTYVAFAGPPG